MLFAGSPSPASDSSDAASPKPHLVVHGDRPDPPRPAAVTRPLKLIIQIPCYNEEHTLAAALGDLPDRIDGIDSIETLIINDGSEDRTIEVARRFGVDHVVDLGGNRGLAVAWSAGMEAALAQGADIIVNTDGDNQYVGRDVAKLVEPILRGEAQMVIGARPIEQIDHFSWLKKRLQRVGSWVVTKFAGVHVPDATSGFRAYSRDAALWLTLTSDFTHTVETIIRAARRGLAIRSVPIEVNAKSRDSRLIRSVPRYVLRQGIEILRVFTMVRPLKVFTLAALVPLLVGAGGCARFLWYYFNGEGGHVQSVVLSAMLIVVGFVVGMIGLAADMVAANRRLLEDSLYRLRKLEHDGLSTPPGDQSAQSRADP